MTTTPNMNLVLPVEGGSSNVWDVILDTLFGVVDTHGHVTGQGVPIVSAALNINADVSWAGYAISHVKAIYLTEQGSAPSTNDAIFALSSDHNLYFRNSSGTNVQITAGNTLNISLVGGIGGDYSSVGALLSYDDATRRYLLQQEGSPRPWAGLATGDIDLYEKAASIVNKVTLKSPAALAGSYTTTWLAALPASTLPLYITSAGQLTNTPPNQQILIPPSAADLNSNGRSAVSGGLGINAIQLNGGVNNYCMFPIPLRVGDKILSAVVYVNKATSNTTTITASCVQTDGVTEATTLVSQASSANAPGALAFTLNPINYTLSSSTYVGIAVAVTAGAGTTDVVLGCAVTYTPAI